MSVIPTANPTLSSLFANTTTIPLPKSFLAKKDLGKGIVVVFANKDDKVGLAVGITDNLTNKFDAVQFVKVGSEIIGGKGGGGRKDFAQA